MFRTAAGTISVAMNSAGRVDLTAPRGCRGLFTVSLDGVRVLDLDLTTLAAAQALSTARNVTLPRAFNLVTIGFGYAAA